MFQRLCKALLLTSSCLVVFAPLQGEDVDSVAGHSLEHYVEQLPSSDRVIRLRAARSLLPFGDRAGEALRAALDHEDPAVRYIAAESLGRIGGDPLEQSVGRLCELAEDESSLAVRVAASFALCRHGLTEPHLDLMIETLDYPERGMACSAAFLIGEIGPDAGEAKEALQRTFDRNRPGDKVGDYHLGGSAMNALRKLSRSSRR